MDNKKTKKRKTSVRTQKGRGLITTHIKTYKNLRYKGSTFVLPELVCPVEHCNGKLFKKKAPVMGTRLRNYMLSDWMNNKYFAFTCVNCGHIQFYSANTTYQSSKLGK